MLSCYLKHNSEADSQIVDDRAVTERSANALLASGSLYASKGDADDLFG